MIGASGVGKTAHYLYPNLEYACASGVSFLVTDTKGDVYRNYGAVAKEHYGYRVAVIDLRNPTRSDGANMLHLISKYADLYQENPDDLRAKAKMEKYAKMKKQSMAMILTRRFPARHTEAAAVGHILISLTDGRVI